MAGEMDPFRDAQLLRESFKLRPLRAVADDHQPGRQCFVKLVEGADQAAQVFFCPQGGHGADHRCVIG